MKELYQRQRKFTNNNKKFTQKPKKTIEFHFSKKTNIEEIRHDPE